MKRNRPSKGFGGVTGYKFRDYIHNQVEYKTYFSEGYFYEIRRKSIIVRRITYHSSPLPIQTKVGKGVSD